MAEILAILGTTIAGISIKEIGLSSIGFSWKMFLTYTRTKLVKKLAKMIIHYTEGKYPHKNLLKPMYKKLTELFKRDGKAEIVKMITYYKELKELFYAVNFNDSYWEENQKELLLNPELLRDYMVKKLYIERIKDILVVKLYNNILKQEDMKELETDLIDTYMNKQITVAELDKIVENLEKELEVQYREQKERYDKDFEDEKKFVIEILEKSKVGLSKRVSKTALEATKEIVRECRNELGQDNYTSTFLKKTRSLSRTNTLETISEKSNPILNMLN